MKQYDMRTDKSLHKPVQLLTVKDVSSYLKVTERTVYRMIAKGELQTKQVGGSTRITVDEYNRYISETAPKPVGMNKEAASVKAA